MNEGRILYEDEDMIVCHKAAGIATQTARIGQADMVSEVTNYLMNQTYVGVVHRLDQPVEGVLVFAKSKRAASELSRQIADNRMEKDYYAVICGQGSARRGTLTDYLLKDGKTNMSGVVPPELKGAKKAVLEYEILAQHIVPEQVNPEGRIALVRIRLHTGRHHQIRVQMSHAGMGLLGDYKYADKETAYVSGQMHVKEVALCAYRLALRHPVSGKRMQFQIRPEGKCFQMEEFLPYYESSDTPCM